ncbi:hypothetical protein [Paraburkholderia fungorum]|uniref:Holin n=1 Tax=Paraburkholderia fungorum TaxID=134537 RepID=A0AAW3V3W0_9BURK|nr:hypothetical protein [Paraburkholderia fungorum]MBB4517284.1 hypothetical protein [Paraburkholderia fungorum]MBB6204352.1 hypothetical protein [Paraburkholderia fungorum]
MSENVEMPIGEWFVRLVCKLIAFGAAILGAGGFMIVGMRTVLPLLNDGRYVAAACTGIAGVAALYGLTPLALAVDQSLLKFSGMQPLRGQGQGASEKR